MKKTVYIFSALLCLSAVAGCSDWGEVPELNILELESANVSFSAYGGTGDIVVKSTAEVTAGCSDAWCTTAVSGNKVTVTVPASGELLGRATMVTIVSAGKKAQVPVAQAGVQIEFDRSPIILSGDAGSATLLVNAPVPVTATSPATWLVSNISGNSLTLRAEANPAFAARAATLTVSAGSLTVPVAITQQACNCKLTLNDYVGTWNFTSTSGTSTVTGRTTKTATVTAPGGDTLSVKLQVVAATTAAATFTFLMFYDANTGKVSIPVQKVFKTGATDVILSLFNGTTGINTTAGSMTGTPTGGTTAKPTLAFTDTGGGVYIGFMLIQVPNYEYSGFGAASTSRYTNITMTKQ
jgi:hypothetical protein